MPVTTGRRAGCSQVFARSLGYGVRRALRSVVIRTTNVFLWVVGRAMVGRGAVEAQVAETVSPETRRSVFIATARDSAGNARTVFANSPEEALATMTSKLVDDVLSCIKKNGARQESGV